MYVVVAENDRKPEFTGKAIEHQKTQILDSILPLNNCVIPGFSF